MGFFSFKTIDTDKSICNTHQDIYTPFRVYMRDDKGNVWVENNYDGYGEFGGKDYYELLEEMNGLESNRDLGIDLAFKDSPSGTNPNIKHPSLNEYESTEWDNSIPESCEFQGYFYEEPKDENWFSEDVNEMGHLAFVASQELQ